MRGEEASSPRPDRSWPIQPWGLEDFVIQMADDPSKADMELYCGLCGELLCDVQHMDSLGALVAVADSHPADCRRERRRRAQRVS